jgi:predicted enzyme related to lactoylglutathione lyase
MPHITYVELNVPKAGEVADFYRAVFDWDPQAWGEDEDYLVSQHGDSPGIDAALRTAPDGRPLTVAVITVPDIDATIEKAKASGAEIVVEKFPIAGVGYAAYFKDPGGLLIGAHENDDSVG